LNSGKGSDEQNAEPQTIPSQNFANPLNMLSNMIAQQQPVQIIGTTAPYIGGLNPALGSLYIPNSNQFNSQQL
jgi:hypothetical protein